MKLKQRTILFNEATLSDLEKIAPRKSLEVDELIRGYICAGVRSDAPYLEDDVSWGDVVTDRHRKIRDEITSE